MRLLKAAIKKLVKSVAYDTFFKLNFHFYEHLQL